MPASRLTRWLFQAEGARVRWDEEGWNLLCNMGEGVKSGMEKCKLETYGQAQRLCDLVSSASGEPYALDSLAGFLCLAGRKSQGRFSELRWPSRPPPVTIADDLEMDPAPMLQTLPELNFAPISRFTRGPICSMRVLILCLDLESHLQLRCCARATCLDGVVPQPLARDEQLQHWVSRLLHVDGPYAIELQRLGIGRGCLARVMALVWDWLDVLEPAMLRSLWREPLLGGIAMVRIALKFEVPEQQLAKALCAFRCARRHRHVLALERNVVQCLPAWRRGADQPVHAD